MPELPTCGAGAPSEGGASAADAEGEEEQAARPEVEDRQQEVPVVAGPDAVVDQHAVVVHPLHATPADAAVMCAGPPLLATPLKRDGKVSSWDSRLGWVASTSLHSSRSSAKLQLFGRAASAGSCRSLPGKVSVSSSHAGAKPGSLKAAMAVL
eukprot:CAMPEP_0171154818 /NCGR_PEP_ID=MMETSP0790-20130122/541_1 /TAXON_ID=2925 /ORGANISM="Alexandrium catenella, Strain OF101" /LENGTH=152 /DNA_ID=CAMNT_0011618939 /DNA_START=318 /DNA_END=776 /DNA_ORIENTATION=-